MRTNRHLFSGKSYVGYSNNEKSLVTSNGEQNPPNDEDEFPSQQFWSSLNSATPLQIEEQPSTSSYHTDTEKPLTTFQKNDQKELSLDDDEFPTQQFWSSLSSVPPLLTEEDQPSTSSQRPFTETHSENVTNFQRKDKHISFLNEDDEFPTQQFWSSLNSVTQLPDVEAQPATSPSQSTEIPLDALAIVQKLRSPRLSKKMEAKRRRLCGESYVGYRRDGNRKIVQDQPRRQKKLGPACTSWVCSQSSVRKCDSITKEQRTVIFQNFWKTMDWAQRKQFVLNMVGRIPVKRRTKADAVSKRDFTLNYHLCVNGEKMQVCQTMFLQTLDIKKWTVRYWVDCASSRNISDEQEEGTREGKREQFDAEELPLEMDQKARVK
ncbi:hypothetical protein JTE90_027232 [Oedothorax gibbosus]|uniref:Uncharacterized protein n=1 Tax=Oedothorax gibbosus TaxID=931172 RepID=A0AAV6U314_9ARAC|nr:hypothetical protein JTE90_027232 [Oedothorax gibbosus]